MTRASQIRKKNVNKEEFKQEESKAYQGRLRRIQLSKSYILNKVKGLFFLERANMLAEELDGAKSIDSLHISEKVDGVPKTVKYAQAEFFMMRMSALNCFQESYFNKCDLMKLGLDEAAIKGIEVEMLEEPVLRESYNEDYRRERWAEFVDY